MRKCADGRPFLTLNQAAVLCAIAAHWKVRGKGVGSTRVGRMIGAPHDQTVRGAMNALMRRGFLTAEWKRNGGKLIVQYQSLRPTPKGWEELGEQAK